MGLTLTKKHRFVDADRVCNIYDVTFDSSYPTGGESLTAFDLGFTAEPVHEVSCGLALAADVAHALPVVYDYANKKLVVFVKAFAASSAGITEADDTTNLSTFTVRVVAWGR